MDNRLERYIRSKCIQYHIIFSDFKIAFLNKKSVLTGENLAALFLEFVEIGLGELRQIRIDSDLIIKDRPERKARRKKQSL